MTLEEVGVAIEVSEGDALRACEWFWMQGDLLERGTSFIELLVDAVKRWPMLRRVVESWRDATAPSGDEDHHGLMDWLALNDALDEPDRTYAWFDDRVRRGAVPIPQMTRLRRRVLERSRPGDLLCLMTDPLEEVHGVLRRQAQVPLEELPSEIKDVMADADCAELALIWRATEMAAPAKAPGVLQAILRGQPSERLKAFLERSFEDLRARELERTAKAIRGRGWAP
jgi:hypothetical protein